MLHVPKIDVRASLAEIGRHDSFFGVASTPFKAFFGPRLELGA
jgi:hypothetical protein